MLTERALAGLHDALFAELPALPPNAAILDVGCGTGAWLARHVAPGRKLVGVDRDAGQFGLAGAQCIACDLDHEDLPFDRASFDLVCAVEVMEHLENPGHLVENAARVLKPGGRFLVSTPNVHSVPARLKHLVSGQIRQFDGSGDPTHITPIVLPFIEAVWPRHGFTIERVWGYPPDGVQLARKWVATGLRCVGWLFPASVPGDALCVLARRDSPATDGGR